MTELPSAYPLRDMFDAAVRQRRVKLTCPTCGHVAVFESAALWWYFRRRGWRDRFDEVRRKCICLPCWRDRGQTVRGPQLELVHDEPTETGLPMPPDIEWKRELRRRR
ncbi:hypothetical protein [Sphingosinicella sp. CPCC 101087]|uniref:hypothetical protein n=1 Tax=Sphingosinicella sp. CPCC 101087 TaxID=2497754 RepID=UPI00101CF05E|nr:hypothetical protein [Sphingosinicella sp. CPCC 101087]